MNSWYELYKAFRRGERRTAPAGTRGRVYEKKNPETSGDIVATAKGKGSITPSRIYRKELDKWFDLVYHEDTGVWEEVDNG